jgi:hypothetical protein
MQRHTTHQIDEVAQQVFRAAIPTVWVYNEQHRDYGKDYLVEIGDDDGNLTGITFFVQLKGQKRVKRTPDGKAITFTLQAKHAAYYADKIKDLPVFLVVVDVTDRRGYWTFIQPSLLTNQSWRQQGTVTISLPTFTDIRDSRKLREAVETAKQTMRLWHPESIQDAVAAHKRFIRETDPRFDVKVSLVNELPVFELRAIEPVEVRLEPKTGSADTVKKLSDLVDKGLLVIFEPGELSVTGSKLFETMETHGGMARYSVEFHGSVTLVFRDAELREVGRVAEVPGRFIGGLKELRFAGGLDSSPLSLEVGPIAAKTAGRFTLHFDLTKWNGQPLLQLAYFDRVCHFAKAAMTAAHVQIDCLRHDECFFSITPPLLNTAFAAPFAAFLTLVDKARKVAKRFGINPAWTLQAFNQDAADTAEELSAIFFEDGFVQKMPNVKLDFKCRRKTFNFDTFQAMAGPVPVQVSSEYHYELMGEVINVGRLTHEFTAMTLALKDWTAKKRAGRGDVQLVLQGTADTVRRIREGDLPETDVGAPPRRLTE